MSPAKLPLVIGLGELLWDVFPDYRVPGGASGNFAFQAQQLGCRGMVVSSVGQDADGDELLQFLTAQGVDTRGVQRAPAHPTSRVTVTVSAEGQPDYVIHEQVAWDHLQMTPALQDAMREASAVCFGTLAQRNETSRETIQQALELVSVNCLRVYDVNLRQNYYHRDTIEASAMKADLVKLNDDEVRLLAPLLKFPTDEVSFAQSLIDHFGTRVVCVTRGAKGCVVVSKDEIHEVPGRPVKVADTVGAGDSFTAALIVSQLKGWPLAIGSEFANHVGGMVAARKGGMPNLREEFAQLIARYEP
ncbi:carbohydrate kinase family protein [Planctomicrobium sp. SH664]|uniref:carbohydrate kinase family protein n=1 Tax=Planctomicrobium sp. SH664 TaxID=3448125 RepID=UPI003F5C4C54